MSSNTPQEQFASAVASAISSVHHLYREVDRLMSGLYDRLAEEPDSLIRVTGTIAKGQRDQTRMVIRNEFGALFSPTVIGEDASEDEEEELDEPGDETEDEDGVKSRKRVPAELAANEPLLAVRIAMYDPQKRESFEPQIQFAVMSEWTVGKGAWDPEQQFLLRSRSVLRRIPKALGSNLGAAKGMRIVTQAPVKNVGKAKKGNERRLGCCLPLGIETVALYTLDTAEALDLLVQRMKSMWNEAIKE